MKALPNGKRVRRAKSFRPAIASAIARRLAAGDPLAIRDIIAEAGGGSTDTVREELGRIGITEAARLLEGDAIRSYAEREAALRVQLERSSRECAALRSENALLREAIQRAAEPSKILEFQVGEIGREVREAVQELIKETIRIRRTRERGTDTVTVPDAALEARYKRLVADNGSLAAKFMTLRRVYFEATGKDFDD